MHITWTWLIAALALCVLAGLLLICLRRRSAREVVPLRLDALAPDLARSKPEARPEPSAAALRASAAARQLQRVRQQARERAEQARHARAASEAAQAEAAAALGQARVDLELDLPAWAEATSPAASPTPTPEVCSRTAQVAAMVQVARQAGIPLRPATTATPPRPPLVLVVDDARTVRVKIGRVLQAQGLRLAFAVDGEDALIQLAGQCPDLLITDMDMPGLDGLALTRALRSRPATADLPVIMVSAADDRLRAQAVAAGVSALLGKPFGDARLVEMVQSLLADQAGRAAVEQHSPAEPA